MVIEVTRDKKVVRQWSGRGLRGIVHLGLLHNHLVP